MGKQAARLAVALSVVALGCVLILGLVTMGRQSRAVLEGLGPEDVNVHLRASSTSLAWACGGKEVADVCLLATETCVSSMQKKVDYTIRQSVARDLGTCSCFQNNGCSASCNSAMMGVFGGFVTVADCGLDDGRFSFFYSQDSPYDMYGSVYDAGYRDAYYPFATVGNFYKAAPGAPTQLAEVDADEAGYVVPVSVRVMAGRKV